MATISDFTIYSREPGSVYCELGSTVDFTSTITLGALSGSRVIPNDSHAYIFENLTEGASLAYSVTANFVDGTSDTETGTVVVRSSKVVSSITTLQFAVTTTPTTLFDMYPLLWNDPMVQTHAKIEADANIQIRFKTTDSYITLLANKEYTYHSVSNFYIKSVAGSANVNVTLDRNIGA